MKMKGLNKILAWVLAMVLVLCAAAPAMAEGTYYYDDYVAYAETMIFDKSMSYVNNLALAVEALNGVEVNYGETFSFNEIIGPRTQQNGYRIAKNGRGARVRGGGVSQLATTLNLAIQDYGLIQADYYHTYGDRFTGGYVYSGSLAVITDYNSDYDYTFTNYCADTLVIEAWLEEDFVCIALSTYDDGNWEYKSGRSLAFGYTTLPFSYNQTANIRLSAESINGTCLNYGETFSFNDTVGPRIEACGYMNALNGRGVYVIGGGVAQTASTIYLAAKQVGSLSIGPIRTYGDRYTGDYVANPDDAIVTDYNAGTDFSFTYYGYGTLQIFLYEVDDMLCCELYEYDD